MDSLVNRPHILLIVQAAAFWPVWRWYIARLTDGSDEWWGLVALVTALVFIWREPAARSVHRESILPTVLVLLYAVACPFTPKLVQAALAVSSLACTASLLRFGIPFHVPTAGLCLLSLPLMASLQFYLGYPFRVVSGMGATLLLHLSGIAVVQEGTCLRWGGELVSIDAPCSGLNMLWAAVYLALTCAGLLGLTSRRAFVAVGAAVAATLLGNALRSAALFQVETEIVKMPGWCHDATGIVVFAAVAIAVAWLSIRLSRSLPCSVRAAS
jgi:exosortase/archaeosortase family protein